MKNLFEKDELEYSRSKNLILNSKNGLITNCGKTTESLKLKIMTSSKNEVVTNCDLPKIKFTHQLPKAFTEKRILRFI